MMQTTLRHSLQNKQPKLGGLAYWSVICAPMFTSNDRTSEITRVREDTV